MAYQNDSPLIPPEGDPEGWKTLPPAVLHGKIFAARYIDVQCTLSLATPLSYTRGTVIPLFLTLSSADAQGLHLLASHKTINVWLGCRVRYHMCPSHARKSIQTGLEWKEVTEFLESAVWWPADDSAEDYRGKRMNGEIRLSKNLMPSTSIAHLTVKVNKSFIIRFLHMILIFLKYFVALMPFEAPAFEPSDAKDGSLISEVVEVTTSLGPGPEPKAYAPPGYDYGNRRPRTSNLIARYAGLSPSGIPF
jgi:hypothetical protein